MNGSIKGIEIMRKFVPPPPALVPSLFLAPLFHPAVPELRSPGEVLGLPDEEQLRAV